jgi:F420-non-reducing hydrogenase iron-sulfur subunit
MEVVAKLLELAGIKRDRVQLRRVSAAEGALFAQYVNDVSETTANLGPFDKDKYQLQLAAIERACNTRRLRWLTGMEHHLQNHDNVYETRTNPDLVIEILDEAIESEYHKGLLLEVLKDGPLSVREMAEKSGMPVYTVSKRLNELENDGLAEFDSHEGTTPKFISLAA